MERSTPPSTQPIGRRALLTGAAASVAALGASAVVPASHARAGGTAVILGDDNVSQVGATSVRDSASTNEAHFCYPLSGVRGESGETTGMGVHGLVTGNSGSALKGQTSGHWSQVAVLGDTTVGNSIGEGIAVKGVTKNGTGLYGSAVGGYALEVEGLSVFSRSGKVSFSPGQAARTIAGRPIISRTLVLATIQGYVAGVWVAGVVLNVAADTFTIRLNKAAPVTLRVGWFIVN